MYLHCVHYVVCMYKSKSVVVLLNSVYIHIYVASLSSATDTSTDNAMALFVSCRVGLERDEVDSWILIGEPSRKYPGIHCKKYACTCTLVY